MRSNILPETDDVRRGDPIDNFSVRRAVIEGETFYDNVTRSIEDDTTPVISSVVSYCHKLVYNLMLFEN